MKRFDCGSVNPGCAGVFTGAGDQSVLDQVLRHSATDHGLLDPPLPYIELVMTHTHPYFPERARGHLRVVRDRRPISAAAMSAAERSAFARSTATLAPVRRVRRPEPCWSRPGPAHDNYRHECLMYAGPGGFLDATVPFVRDGLARLEPVMVAIAEPRLSALRSALGVDAERVMFADMAELDQNPALIIPAWQDFIERHGGAGRPVRGIGEPTWAERQPAAIIEGQLHEALLNVAVPHNIPLWLQCPYDTSALDEQVLTEALRSHPVVVEADAHRSSTGYGGVALVEHFFRNPLPGPGARTTPVDFDPTGDAHVRAILRFAAAAGLPIDRAVKLATAVDEIALTADRDTGSVHIRLWLERAALICEIADPGMVDDPMIGRGAGVGPFSRRDRAVRLANQLCDLVQVRSGSTGTATRIQCWR